MDKDPGKCIIKTPESSCSWIPRELACGNSINIISWTKEEKEWKKSVEKMKRSFYTKMKISNYDRNFWVEYLVADSKRPKIFDDSTDTKTLSKSLHNLYMNVETGDDIIYSVNIEQ